MANTIFKLRRSTVAGKVPNTSTLAIGELALNLTDQKLYSSDGSSVWETGANLSSLSVGNSSNKFLKVDSSGLAVNTTINLNNDVRLSFDAVSGSSNVYFIQQNDDNFVFYNTNTSGGSKPVFSVYANTNSPAQNSAFKLSVPLDLGSNPLYANGSQGTLNQVLASNGSSVFWSTPGVTTINTAASYTWSNTHTFQTNVSFTDKIGLNTNNALYFNGVADANWRMARNSNNVTKWVYTGNTIDIVTANSTGEGFTIGLNGNASYLETGYLGTYVANKVTVGSSASNVTINSTAISANSITVGSANTATFTNINGQANASAGQFLSNAYAYLSGYGGNYLAFGQQTNFHQWIQSGYSHASTPVYYSIIFNPLGGNVGISNTAPVDKLSVNGTTFLGGNVTLGSSGLSANGSYGSAGQSLLSNGSATYWATAGATLNANNSDTQTYYIGLANSSTGAWTNAVVSTTKLYYVPSTGKLDASIVNAASFTVGTAFTANATVVNAVTYYVGSTLIGNSTGPYGKTEATLNVNSALTSNNSTYLNGQLSSYYAANSSLANYALLAGATFSGDVTINANLIVSGTTFTVNTTTLDVKDKNITVAKGSTAAASDGAGITVDGSNIGWYYTYASNTWTSNVGITPSANVSFDIGSASLNWRTVYANSITAINLSGNGSSVTSVNAVALGGKTEGNLNVNNALTANNSTNLGGTAAASYALKADTTYVGTTAITLNRATAAQALTGITSIDGSAATLTTARTIGDVSFNGSAAIVPERILFKDTRSTNYNPFSYSGATLHLKTNTTDSLSDGGTYHGVLDLAHWSDSSGGVNHQLGLTDNGNMYVRYSTNATNWSSWSLFQLNSTLNANIASYLPNYSGVVNASSLNVGTAFTANATVVNAVSYYAGATLIANTTGPYGKTEGSLNVNSSIYANGSSTNTFTIGTAAYHVANGNFGIGNSTPADKLVVAGNIMPSADITYNVGTASLRWANVQCNRVYTQYADATGFTSGSYGTSSGGLSINQTGFYLGNTALTTILGVGSLAFGSSFIANTTGVYHIGTVNAASHTVGTAFTANSTVVNAVSYYAGTTLIGNTTGPYGKTEATLNVNSAIYANGSITNTFTVGTGAYFTSTGRLGINTNNPQGGLHVNNTFSYFTANSTYGPQIINWSQTPDVTAGYYIFDKSRSAAGANVAVNDNLGTLLYRGYDTTSTVRNSSYITATVTAVNATAVDSALSVIAAGTSSYVALGANNAEAVRLVANGNFGIGTSSPDQKLVVAGTIQSGNTGTNGNLYLGGANVSLRSATASDVLGIYTNNTEQVRILASGNVGIGNTAPAHKLSVNGILYVGNVVTLGAAGGGLEGAQIDWAAGNSSYNSWSTDVYSNNLRILTPPSGTVANSQVQIFSANASYESGLYVQGNTGIGTSSPAYKLQVNGSFAATTKSFVIDHPTKPDMQLRHGSLEGPENGVYVRGRLTNKHHIEFPDYWEGLVDHDTITVQLTPIGKSKQPSVGDFTDNGVNIIGKNVDCYYYIMAERKDVEKLIVEF